jgi:hypothetical protein
MDTKSTSTKPGGGSVQSLTVRTGTDRRTAELNPAGRRWLWLATTRTGSSRRSTAAGLIASRCRRSRTVDERSAMPFQRWQHRDQGLEALRAEAIGGFPDYDQRFAHLRPVTDPPTRRRQRGGSGRQQTTFLVRPSRWFRGRRIQVERVMTDNGSGYVARLFRKALQMLGIGHICTRPYARKPRMRLNSPFLCWACYSPPAYR